MLRPLLLRQAGTFSYPDVAVIVSQFQDKSIIGIQRICIHIYLQWEEKQYNGSDSGLPLIKHVREVVAGTNHPSLLS